mmetsp:Transcript_26910/g.31077  ORF Transcript_26910/g.31077 Transcript_26910/m.31077 type:complete len:198 (+) Transcript_26910:1-594(+)
MEPAAPRAPQSITFKLKSHLLFYQRIFRNLFCSTFDCQASADFLNLETRSLFCAEHYSESVRAKSKNQSHKLPIDHMKNSIVKSLCKLDEKLVMVNAYSAIARDQGVSQLTEEAVTNVQEEVEHVINSTKALVGKITSYYAFDFLKKSILAIEEFGNDILKDAGEKVLKEFTKKVILNRVSEFVKDKNPELKFDSNS